MAQKQSIIFFDLDGTLIDVSGRHYQVYSRLVHQFDGRPLPKDTYWNKKRLQIKWPALLSESHINERRASEFLQEFIQLIEQPDLLGTDPLFPDSLKTLKLLSKGYKIYLVSLRRNSDNLLGQLTELGIRDLFDQILTGHSETTGEDVKMALIKPVATAGRDIIVGDTEADVLTGKALGLITVALTSGIREAAFLKALQPDFILSRIGELPKVLGG